ncbi:uncharacterized protein LOC121739758 isoform X2 [Aricia agestis]|uniref:uncharacterized protein LOC121739758 isoform X2 n=1 Tax=Aricia agestis TaxID=91739 RepID=UPI001C209AE5|nr:uncharacterized protein LOC121739758 isoform X2 [Aricia agestis]
MMLPAKPWIAVDATTVEARKKHIQEEITSVLQLYVDEVKANGVLTNNWYTARTALSDKCRHKFADILGIEHWLVDGLHFILVAISSGLPIDADKFGDVCRDLAHRYVSQYAWHPMTVTIHKILVHGKDIIKSTKLGMLSQQSAQPRNRFWRSGCDRNHKTITTQSQHITDLFYRALESSDPVITDMGRSRIGKYQKLNITDEMKSILLPIQNRNNINLDCGDDVHVSDKESDDDGDEDDDDDDDDDLNGFCLDREDLD